VADSIRVVCSQCERDDTAPVVAGNCVPAESEVVAQQLIDVGGDGPLVIATGGPGGVAQPPQSGATMRYSFCSSVITSRQQYQLCG
jgi:hypothetical protein